MVKLNFKTQRIIKIKKNKKANLRRLEFVKNGKRKTLYKINIKIFDKWCCDQHFQLVGLENIL